MTHYKDSRGDTYATMRENDKVTINELEDLVEKLNYDGNVYIRTDNGIIRDFALKVDYVTFDLIIDLRESSNVDHSNADSDFFNGNEIEPLM